MKLLEDVFIIENLQVLNEGKAGTGPMKVRGVFQRAEEANNNKRIYRRPLLEREIGKLATAMNERRLLGELDHPQHDSVKLSNVSHLITGLSMKGNEVIGEAEILDTPAGKVAKALINGGVKIGISSRGMGTVTEELDGKRYVNEDFRLITWDIVADPSTRGAYPGLTESTQIQEIIDRVLPEARKVKNFTTLLKEELLTETISKGKKQGGSRPSIDTQRHRMGAKAASKKLIVTDPNMRALVTPVERRTDSDERQKAIDAAAADNKVASQQYNTSQQHSSTQFVNFMRDKLMENTAAYAEILKRRAKLDKNIEYAKAQKKKGEAKRNDSSTQFVNFMRYKLIEMKMQIHPIAKKYGSKRMGDKSRPRIKDPVVRTAVKKYQRRVGQKLRTKVNLPADVAVQGSLNVRRRRAKAGKSVPGSPSMGPESAADRRADFEQDKERRKAPGDR